MIVRDMILLDDSRDPTLMIIDVDGMCNTSRLRRTRHGFKIWTQPPVLHRIGINLLPKRVFV